MLVIPLSYDRPPLTMNRPIANRYARQRVIGEVQIEVGHRIRALPRRQRDAFPIRVPVSIVLVWSVPDNRVRDTTGPTPTLKAVEDGLVRAGVLVDDRHEMVPRSGCRIDVTGRYGMHVEITRIQPRPLIPPSIIAV